MKDAKYFIDGFKTLGEKNNYVKEIDDLINNNHPAEDLEKKLIEISNLADKERKEDTKQSIIIWSFIIVSIVSMYLSINISAYWFLLSLPALFFTAGLLITLKNPMYLFFKYDSGMLEYINGTKPKDMQEPYLSYIYMEKRLQIRIKQIKDS